MAAGPHGCCPPWHRRPKPQPLTPALPLQQRAAPARRRSAPAGGVCPGCALPTDHRVDVTAQRVSGQKGGHGKRLFAYSGSIKQVERVARRPEMVLEEIPKGNASPLLRSMEMGDEGAYSCLASVAPLTGEQTIQLQREEKPTATINVNSLSLLEGEQHKLVCNIGHYYPHDNQAQWLWEPKDTWKVPDVMKNVLSSSHWQSGNGTYSSSRYFLLTASLKDDGHKCTCWVDHPCLQSPVRRSVTVEVREATSTAWLLLRLSLAVCLAGTLCYHHKGKITSRLPNPGCGEGRSLLVVALLCQPSPREECC
ncbi:tapasin-related protein-like [Aptenodytes patagonicus]|uniref:tapasin-related protein-like n=1 Tax=Aptenodytes patagonicus TaxID=9234 RepID=UPI003FA15DA4